MTFSILMYSCVLFLFFTTPAFSQSPSITIDLGGSLIAINPTPKQVQAIDFITADYNKSVPPGQALTSEQFIELLLVGMLRDYVGHMRKQDGRLACEKFNQLPTQAQAGILNKLDGKSPCP